jgi:hypothetical protein
MLINYYEQAMCGFKNKVFKGVPYIIQVLEKGVSYRNIKTKTNICWNTFRIKIKIFILKAGN